jgi:4-azaleucine resistance transporter AzlC
MSRDLQAESNSPGKWAAKATLVLPIVLGYVPIGLSFGVLAQKAGLSMLNTLLMSILVYAGSAQFVAIGLLTAGVSAASIITTTFVVNLRHLLMSVALSPHLRKWSKPELAAFAYQLTDETFALHAAQFARGPARKGDTFSVNAAAQAAWVLGTAVGMIAGQRVVDVSVFGLDYALPAMFVALLVLQLGSRIQAGVALLAGTLATALALTDAGQWATIVATIVGSASGVALEIWIRQRSP